LPASDAWREWPVKATQRGAKRSTPLGARKRQEHPQMKCPFCGHLGDKVVDSRESKEGEVIRRRRECLECGRRFTSYERIDEIPYMVIKKDGTRERFERQKLIAGLLKACEKRPVSVAALEGVADTIEATLQERPEKEMSTEEVGQLVMDELKRLDKVAYVRFASVYRHFRDIGEFMTELKDLLNAKE
jgi:transcriptional repressor NrdR